jgi:hypothetical protein
VLGICSMQLGAKSAGPLVTGTADALDARHADARHADALFARASDIRAGVRRSLRWRGSRSPTPELPTRLRSADAASDGSAELTTQRYSGAILASP